LLRRPAWRLVGKAVRAAPSAVSCQRRGQASSTARICSWIMVLPRC